MTSTSSGCSENGDYCQCANSLDDNFNINNCSFSYYGRHIGSCRHVPFCTTMGHPLIYYAEIQRPSCRRQRCEPPRKENQNCFVKAFKWYTQERIPDERKKYDDIVPSSGFTNWLDNKYIEYLRESRPNQVYQLTVQETTTIDPCPPSSPCEPCTTKRFARMRSPWRKRRRPCKDAGDVEKGPNQSCEFIMQPKDLTRAASDCCYPAPTSDCFKSNATVASSNVPGMTRCSRRSHSLSSICRERSIPKHIDTIPCTVQEGSKTQQPTKQPTICRREQIQQMPSKSRRADVSCQCPEEHVLLVNAETQYEAMGCIPYVPENYAPCYCIIDDGRTSKPVKVRSREIPTPEMKPSRAPSTQSTKKQKKTKKRPSVSSQCPEESSTARVDTQCQFPSESINVCECRNICAPCRDFKEMNQVFGPKTLKRQSLSTVVVNETADACECTVPEVSTMSKCTCSLPCFENDAQTSDHSICLERAGPNAYPLFLKIVCADRLN